MLEIRCIIRNVQAKVFSFTEQIFIQIVYQCISLCARGKDEGVGTAVIDRDSLDKITICKGNRCNLNYEITYQIHI